ncbi:MULTISPECIES: endonuclease MutS2 [Leeuwenhoekiella]|jgi:DNA mismatch repair protein MutS2|uniref:endonuclease MutS2 n=1 Tax=Leeuwenhoekiella TaxID=283735 RepID=UPI000C3D6A5C|nr:MULTISPECIES: DNA mismatch repair protein MutS [Leeuwenhoekiella]MAO42043.1 DNA mismatch repair protein MutS [Leeuwenhoekiella sp.]MBQ52051.1 DNA mismatch repair protein MutS [Leeuwenhoekiella sp.]HCW65071.1 DNA mismatch repair protein MutS [Leeuwenhoekiella sp.]|tara:strand:+ start:1527 stop:3704 length:2178 start_codon:yes stop_codon:yes gene_type:complete
MIKIHPKTLSDLEFHTVCAQLSELCITDMGKVKALKLAPQRNYRKTLFVLDQTQEYINSDTHETPIPNHGFDALDHELKMLGIEDTVLEVGSFRKIGSLSETVNTHLRYFRKFQETFPVLHQTVRDTEYTTELTDEINTIVDRFGEIKDDASPVLLQTRRAINEVKAKINSSFASALSRYASFGYLDEIRESIVDNVRVLAVSAMHRRKVKGSILGNSKTGSIVYIQPEATQTHQRELNNLLYDEQEEVKRILKALTNFVRPFGPLLKDYQKLLSTIDVIAAKAKYAKKLDAVLPKITKNRELEIKEAYHPLLLLNNRKRGEKTYPQDIKLDENNRIIVISGPNAGGKSITLKTVGLLQVMLQSGLLVPVHEYSRFCLFDKILTDIGDNQSIENHLSTYSYRLKNMNYFLRKCDDKTLFLIDEFGTGSDPELGGALAETFLEVFYERNSYGIITTHYANLKMMANETEAITNANMLFDSRTLEPLYKLYVGEAGSSFTFEVAQKNGIPYSLINRSKKKVERGKIRFDKSIANLQKERSKLAKTTTSLKTKEQEAAKQQQELNKTNARIQEKLESYQELYDSNQRLIYLGQKLDDLSDKFFTNKNKKLLLDELYKVVQIENSKRRKQNAKQKRAQKAKERRVKQEAEKKVEVIRQKKKEEKQKEIQVEKEKPKITLQVGDQVRLPDGRAVGSIDKIEKGKATVDYGMFTTQVDVDTLEFVKRPKTK